MAQNRAYEVYLQNPLFVKYGIVCSSMVWEKNNSDIAEAFNVTKQYVGKILKRWKEEENFDDRRASNGGSNKKIDQRMRDSMEELIENNPGSSLRNLAEEMKDAMEVEISHITIGRALKAEGFVKTKPQKIPYLSDQATSKRMEYATSHLTDKFTNVCFSDEVIFQMNENRQLIWWNKNNEDRPVFEESYDKAKVMIWGGISRRGKTDLYYWKISKDLSVNAVGYTECLQETLIDKMNGLYGVGKWRFMQDNARPHTASHTQTFLEENEIRTIYHPPYSPDLNPIEKIWAHLKAKVMTREYKNLDDVLDKVIEEWENIPLKMINNLIDGHCSRVQEVYNNNGSFI
jgi:transposase